jgi:hypothetical protein
MTRLVGLLLVLAATPAFGAARPPVLPDPVKTPGVVMAPAVSVAQVCTPGYARSVRAVSQALKARVYALYGIEPGGHWVHAKSGRRVWQSDNEVDHLISLELGGSNDLGNLWIESYLTKPWNAWKKDALENRLHWLVCHRGLPLAAAQRAIATNWIRAYQHFVVENAVR